MSEVINVVHVLRLGKPVCPKCGSLHEDEGGSVRESGDYESGPMYWLCEACEHDFGHA